MSSNGVTEDDDFGDYALREYSYDEQDLFHARVLS